MYVEKINDEVEGAKDYAEKYVYYKAKGDMTKANKYKEMSNDELKHAMFIHDYEAVPMIEEISKVFKAPAKMQKKWDEAHAEYVEHVAWVKQMLAM